jgi:hypothetical protein
MSANLTANLDDTSPPDPSRAALATAIAQHAEATAAVRENKAAQERVDDIKWPAYAALEEAEEQLRHARLADPEGVARGGTTEALKAAVAQVKAAEDAVEAARSAGQMLKDQHRTLVGQADSSDTKLNSAIAAVLRGSPQTRELIDEYRATQRRLFDLREAIREVWCLHGALPDDAKNWEAVNWDQGLPPSQLAAAVKDWIGRLKLDPEATLNYAPRVA